jgi:hypothetical protein
LGPNAHSCGFLFGEGDNDNDNDNDEPLQINGSYWQILAAVWNADKFKELLKMVRGTVGTHSMRKSASTWPSTHGISLEDIEIHGRWKGGKNGQTVNKYINVE